jgi:hypothetical protein
MMTMEMIEPTTKADLLQMVENGRAEFMALINQIPQERMLETGVESNWSVKDILAHIAAWELKMSQVFAELQQSDAPPDWPTTDEAVDALNANFYETNRDKPLAQVIADFDAAYPQALAATKAMSEGDLFDPRRFAWREGRPLWWMVAGNTFGHYGDHIPNIETWLAGQ